MHRTYNKFLIIIALAILLSGTYVYFSHDLDAQAATPNNDNGSSLVSSNLLPTGLASDSKNEKISQDTAFLTTLTSLNKLKIDTSIFSMQSFMSLRDNTVTLEQVAPGRPNPFAPINSENNSTVVATEVSPVTTNEASEVTNNSAILNGTIDSSITGVASSYFEYGPTEALGTVTAGAKQSLIGTFFTSLTGLKPKTKYYFSAVAKINGALNYGEIVSFTTN